jgi:hypothetical protein
MGRYVPPNDPSEANKQFPKEVVDPSTVCLLLSR